MELLLGGGHHLLDRLVHLFSVLSRERPARVLESELHCLNAVLQGAPVVLEVRVLDNLLCALLGVRLLTVNLSVKRLELQGDLVRLRLILPHHTAMSSCFIDSRQGCITFFPGGSVQGAVGRTSGAWHASAPFDPRDGLLHKFECQI